MSEDAECRGGLDGDSERQNAVWTASQRRYLMGDGESGGERAVRQRMRDGCEECGVLDLGLGLRRLERRDVARVGEELDVGEVDEAIAFLELLRRHAGGGRGRGRVEVEYVGGDVDALERRLERLEDGVEGLSRALQVTGFVGDRDDG